MAEELCVKNKFELTKPENEITPGIEAFLIYKEISIEKILKYSTKGKAFQDIIQIVKNEIEGADEVAIENYVSTLIDNKLLVDNLPPYTNSIEDPLIELTTCFRELLLSTNLLDAVKENLIKKTGEKNQTVYLVE